MTQLLQGVGLACLLHSCCMVLVWRACDTAAAYYWFGVPTTQLLHGVCMSCLHATQLLHGV